ncbi:s-adenosyl-methyltransferase [Stylonychia lemnae]|uniref:S-adenosyl-methyltransferase n=1 Tax=Stylonychia lemnae TaxID=5949 RepID=A0A078B5N0_STYLE|nr:s-adenosyl-methyltransferase [Stylonychia lemnae]|eukprot:CDW88612.1 s-adenosyl-methyltransferase [Stylonychia lemnae]
MVIKYLTRKLFSTLASSPPAVEQTQKFLQIGQTTHYPVMYREVQAMVDDFIAHNEKEKLDFQMLDCTFGGGNHSVPLLRKHQALKILGTDLDSKTLDVCRVQYSDLIKEKRLALEHMNFVNSFGVDPRGSFKQRFGVKDRYDIALLDLGFSSYQLEDTERGFSYIGPDEQPLDMRFDHNSEKQSSAADIVNNASELELSSIFKKFGDEKYSSQLAKKLIQFRQGKMILTTGQLKEAIRDAFPNSSRDEKNQTIKRIFQAIRISTNYELLNLQTFLEYVQKGKIMDQNSMLMIITFHSLEEKLVSQSFVKWKKFEKGNFGTKKPLIPSNEEVQENSRSKSAKLYTFLFD